MFFDVSVQPSLPKGRIGSHGPTPHIGDQTHQGPHLQSPVQICEAMQIWRNLALLHTAPACCRMSITFATPYWSQPSQPNRSQIAFESIVSHCSKCKNNIKMYKIVAFTSQNLLWTHQLASTCSALFLSSGKSWVYCPSAAFGSPGWSPWTEPWLWPIGSSGLKLLLNTRAMTVPTVTCLQLQLMEKMRS